MTRSERLLVVDDLEANRDLLTRRLRRREYDVASVDSGEAALAYIDAHTVDLVLLDIAMPGLSGLDVLRHLRERFSAVQLPVIMVTARSDSAVVVEALNLGANDYVTKPIDFPVVLARIQTHLELHRRDAALRESEERYALAVQGTNDGLWDWRLASGEVYYSPRWRAIVGCAEAEIGDRIEDWHARVHPADLERLTGAVARMSDGGDTHFECEHRLLHRDGTYRWVVTRGLAVRDAAGAIVRLAGSTSDVTEGKIVDPLTGLPNHVLLVDRLERLMERARRHPETGFAVLALDIDRFKVVNDSLGRATGDELLMAFAARVLRHLRLTDALVRGSQTLARIGGDEFTVVLEDVRNAAEALRVAERVQSLMRTPFDLDGREVVISVSIGVAVSRPDAGSADEILREADMAMHCAKTQGKGRAEVFEAGMRVRVAHRLQQESDLRRALERQDFRVYYQPIVSLVTGRIESFEALVRWDHDGTVRGPGDFLHVAEDTGLMLPITLFVLREACRAAVEWRRLSPGLTIGVNISPQVLIENAPVELVRDCLAATGLPASALHLEMTETAMIGTSDVVNRTLRSLHEMGVRISLDDFGTGYSSLSYLHRFPVDTLKIDQSFVRTLHRPENEAIVQSVLMLGRHLRMDVVAEGIETDEQLQTLRAFGCAYGQGFLLSMPVDHARATELLTRVDWPFQKHVMGHSVVQVTDRLPLSRPSAFS